MPLGKKTAAGKPTSGRPGAAHITANKNTIPGAPEMPFVASGIRPGSPAMATRGFGPAEDETIGNLIADVPEAPEDAAAIERMRTQVAEPTRRFPMYSRQRAEEATVRHATNDAVERLLGAIEADSDDCWAMYEEIGRVVVGRLRLADRDALRAIARAWVASDDAQAALVDTDRDSPGLDAAKDRAAHVDGMLRDVIRNVLFPEAT